MALHDRDAGWLTHASDDRPGELVEHPAVVLRVVGDRFVVIHGTRTPRDRNGRRLADEEIPGAPDTAVFWVDSGSYEGDALGITARTFFHSRAVEVIRNEGDFRVTARCPPDLFLALRKIAGFAH